jgi:phospholipid-binding lipoprotein MlaA
MVPAPAAPAQPEPVSAPAVASDYASDAHVVIAARQPSDPLQRINRQMFRADRVFDHAFTGLDGAKNRARPARKAVFNVLSNLEEPATAANSVLQRKPGGVLRATARFAINSSLGLGGLIDVADRMGLKRVREDFGRTLGMYGVKPGPYIYLPLLGPTTVRDMAGNMIDGFVSPTRLLHIGLLQGRAQGVLKRKVKEAEYAARRQEAGESRQADDDYAVVRARYLGRRIDAAPAPVMTAAAAAPSMATAGGADR